MTQRPFIATGLTGPALSKFNAGAESPARGNPIVLVHGASHGGWCWRSLAERLRAIGYRTFAPTLTGLGERVHLRSPDITVDTHIDDVVNLIQCEELERVVIVGHSYGGTVITGVCDRIKDRMALAVFLDANTPRDGEATIPGLTKELAEKFSGKPLRDGYLLPALDPARLGIATEDRDTSAWLKRRLTEQPIRTVAEPIQLKNGGTDGLPRTFVLTTPLEQLQGWQQAKVLAIRADPSWDYREMLAGHDAMITAPLETAKLLDEIIQQRVSAGTVTDVSVPKK